MMDNGGSDEQSPAKSPWTSDNTFIRSRFIVKRLKRMRSKTKSFSEGIVDESFRYQSQEPASLPYDINHPSTSSVRYSLAIDPEQYTCCKNVQDIVNTSIRNRHRLKEEQVLFEDEIVESLSRKQSDSTAISECSLPKIDNTNELFEISSESQNNYGLNLLEEIEDALPKEYSLKRILFCFYSVTMYRALMRLSRPLFTVNKNSLLEPNATDTKESIENELNRLQVELMVQKMLKDQAKKALAVSNFAKCTQEGQLEAEKALLLACIKQEAVEREMMKLGKMEPGDVWLKEESASASIKEIKIVVENPAVWHAYNFIVVAVERDHVKGSDFEYVLHDSTLCFTTPLHFYNLSPNFTIQLYLYGIPTKDTKIKLYRSNERLNFLNQKLHKKQNSVSLLSTTASHNFTLMGTAVVQRSHFTRTKITLLTQNCGNVSSAMEINMRGNVYLNSLCTGFLDIRNQSDAASVWTRYWFRLTGLDLQGWSYPLYQISQTPAFSLNVNQCTTEAKPESIFHCVRPNTFYFLLKNEQGSVEKMQCSADSCADVETWCHHLNKAINACRIWDS